MPIVSVLLFYLVIVIFLYFTFKNKKPLKWNEVLNALTFTRHNDDTLRVPGPIQIPVFGTKWINKFMDMSKLHEYYADLNRKYGDVVMEMAGNVPVVSLFSKKDIDKVMKAPSKYPFRPPTELIAFYRLTRPDRYASVGLPNTQGLEWAHLRMKLTPKTLESRKVLAAFCPDLNRCCDDFINVIKQQRNDQNVVIKTDDILKAFAIETAACLILGRRTGTTADAEMFQKLATAAKNVFQGCRDAYYGNGLWKYFPTKMYKSYVKAEETIYDTVTQLVNETMSNESILQSKGSTECLMLTLLKTEGLDKREQISGTIDFLVAGIELVSHTVAFIIYYFTQNPEVQEKIFEETVNMKENLTVEDLSRAFYTRAAIHEAFRMSPSAFAIARMLEDDLYLSGYNIKSGTVVLCQNMVACTNNEYFENAAAYKPERWINESGEFDLNRCKGSSIVLPFGYGKRICPGKKYSEMELMILVIKLVRSFKMKYEGELDRQFEFVLAPKGPVNIQFCDR